jgi:hypothetical protein
MEAFKSLFFGSSGDLERLMDESPQKEAYSCIGGCWCTKNSIPRVVYRMGIAQILLAWGVALIAFPIFIISIM